ncbi:MAG TPA: tyrosine-type recombinase/integrase [Pseudomonadota bacterium]|nr:tyrosine-type recombinase/integrase [Pseudomonadota bacterium]
MGDIVRTVRNGRFLGWYVRYIDIDGKRKQRASHQPSKELARRYLREVEGRIARGIIGIPEASTVPTVAALAERFLTEYSRPRLKDVAAYRCNARKALQRALGTLGDQKADAVRTEDVARLRDRLAQDFAPSSVKMTLAFLSTMYSWASKQGLVHGNPLRGLERPVPAAAVDYLDRGEVKELLRLAWERAPQNLEARRLAVAVELALRVGMRKGELLGLRWCDLDLDTQRLTVARSFESTTKSGKTRHLRLPAACIEPLREWRRLSMQSPQSPQSSQSSAGLVFPGPEGRCYSAHALLGLPQLLAAAGCRVPAHPWHALRHTFASHFIMAGGNILTLQRILGHADVKMTLIYAHLAPDFLGQELERLKY